MTKAFALQTASIHRVPVRSNHRGPARPARQASAESRCGTETRRERSRSTSIDISKAHGQPRPPDVTDRTAPAPGHRCFPRSPGVDAEPGCHLASHAQFADTLLVECPVQKPSVPPAAPGTGGRADDLSCHRPTGRRDPRSAIRRTFSPHAAAPESGADHGRRRAQQGSGRRGHPGRDRGAVWSVAVTCVLGAPDRTASKGARRPDSRDVSLREGGVVSQPSCRGSWENLR